MSGICDVCGRALTQPEIKILTGPLLWKATSNGYVPTNLPATWKVPGADVASHWRGIVAANKVEDWGLCSGCSTEVNDFNSQHFQGQEGRGIAPDLKSQLAKLFENFSAATADHFWAKARKLGGYSEVLSAMEELQEVAQNPAVVMGAVMGMKRIPSAAWDAEYLARPKQDALVERKAEPRTKEEIMEALRPAIKRFVDTDDARPFLQIAESCCTPQVAVDMLFVYVTDPNIRSGRSSFGGGVPFALVLHSVTDRTSNLIAHIQTDYSNDSWDEKFQDDVSRLRAHKAFVIRSKIAEETITLERERRRHEFEEKNKEKAAIAEKAHKVANEQREQLRGRIASLEYEIPAALEKLKKMQNPGVFRKRASEEATKEQREMLMMLMKEKSAAEEKLKRI